MMKWKLVLSSAAALVIGGGVLAASVAPASADEWNHPHAWGPVAAAGDIVDGTVAAVTSPLWAPGYYGDGPDYRYRRDYAYGDGPYENYGLPLVEGRSAFVDEPTGDDVAYCQAHFRSYDPSSGTYLGYDGMRHSCP
jgi:hypothetical protein